MSSRTNETFEQLGGRRVGPTDERCGRSAEAQQGLSDEFGIAVLAARSNEHCAVQECRELGPHPLADAKTENNALLRPDLD
eukprot:1643002-Rhodomonas_salina.1